MLTLYFCYCPLSEVALMYAALRTLPELSFQVIVVILTVDCSYTDR